MTDTFPPESYILPANSAFGAPPSSPEQLFEKLKMALQREALYFSSGYKMSIDEQRLATYQLIG